MGFYLPMNFNSPYKSQNPQEFWRRWHMSLGRWLKTYLYIPLGGNRKIGFGTYFWLSVIALVSAALTGWWIWILVPFGVFMVGVFVWDKIISHRSSVISNQQKLLYSNLNSFITQVMGGLWHGASWNFIIWGGINGIGMIVNKIWREMGWHLRFGAMTLLTASLCVLDYTTNLPHGVCLPFGPLSCGSVRRYGTSISYAKALIISSRKRWVRHGPLRRHSRLSPSHVCSSGPAVTLIRQQRMR